MSLRQAEAESLIHAGELSNREIARRTGYDEKTIRNWKRKEDGILPASQSTTNETIETQDSLTTTFTSERKIESKEDAARLAGVDLTKWTIEKVKTKAYQVAMKVKTGKGAQKPIVKQLWGITVTFVPRTGPDTLEAINAMVDGAVRARGKVSLLPCVSSPFIIERGDTMQQIVIADPHLSKLCWPGGTADAAYDLDIAANLVFGGVKYLAARESAKTRTLAFLGDYFHYDTLSGTTTGGTQQDRDSRLPKMLDVGTELAVRCINHLATLGNVRVIIVAGNHDTVLTSALQRILVSEFRNSGNVNVDDTHTKRKYVQWGKNLFGYDHGDKRKKQLASSMSIEVPKLWGESVYREYHTGHLHNEEELFYGTLTHHGVIVRTHPSMSPPDQWHSDEQYIGATRGMQSFTYHRDGGCIASAIATPRMLLK